MYKLKGGLLYNTDCFSYGQGTIQASYAVMRQLLFYICVYGLCRLFFRQEQDREMKMYREVYARHKDFLHACVGQEFELVSDSLTCIR